MKTGKWLVVLVALAALAGCKNFWQAPSHSGGGGGGSGATSGVFYVANQATSQLASYSIVSGKLSALSGSPSTLAVPPRAIAVAPSGNFLYVGTVGGGIFLFSIGSGGTVSIENGGSAVSADPAFAMQVDAGGAWLVDAFVTLSGGVQVNAIPITASGAIDLSRTVQSPVFNLSGATVNGLAIAPDDGHVFVAAGTAGTLVIPFASASSTPLSAGSASTIRPLSAGGSALSVAVDPTNRLFYIGETLASASGKSGGLRAFVYSSLSGSTVTQAGGSPIDSGGLAPSAILALSTGDYVFAANGQGTSNAGNIQGFAVTAGGSAAAPTYTVANAGNSVATGNQPVGLAEDNQGNYVLVVDSGGNPDLEAYTIGSGGALTSVLSSATGNDPVQASAIAALP